MKKRSLLLCTITLLISVLFGGLFWLMYTVSGTSFLLKRITCLLPQNVEIGKISGRMGYSLRMEGLRIKTQEVDITTGTMDLKWQPFLLLTGRLTIIDLGIHGVVITHNKPPEDTPFDLTFPKVPKWLTLLSGQTNSFRLSDLTYVKSGKESVTIESITAKILWGKGKLYINKIKAKTSFGSANGDFMVEPNRPELETQFQIVLKKEITGIDSVSVRGELLPSKGGEQIAGPVTLKASMGSRERFNVECRLAITPQAVHVSSAKFTERERKGSLVADGVLDLSGKKPAFTLSTKVLNLDFSPETRVKTDISGNLDISGTMENYNGKFSLKNTGAAWRSLELTGKIHGEADHIEITALQGKSLGGAVIGEFRVSWVEGMMLSARLGGRNLNPTIIHPDLQGNLNIDLQGNLQTPDNRPMKGSLTADVLDSQFQKKAVRGKLDTVLYGETVQIKTLSVKGNGFSIAAAGTLQQRLQYTVQIDDASRLLPETKGFLSAKGWVRWRDGEPAGIMHIEGSNISYEKAGASSLRGVIEIPDGNKGEIAIDIVGKNVHYAALRLNSTELRIHGQRDNHRINLSVRDREDRTHILAEGQYTDGAWLGTILNMSGKETSFGSYGLERPSKVHISGKKIFFSPFSVIGAGGERLDINVNIARNPVAGFADIRWQQINLARANRFVGSPKLEGQTSGTLRGEWSAGRNFSLSGRINGSGIFSQDAFKLRVSGINGEVVWKKTGLFMSCDAFFGDGGQINATAASPEPAALTFPEIGYLRLAWKSVNMNIFHPVFPDMVRINGRSDGEIRGKFLAGKRFDLSGKTVLAGGSLSWHTANGQITAAAKEASLRFAWKDGHVEGRANLILERHGFLETSFRLAVPAGFPVNIDNNNSIIATARGELHEKGLLTALFPGLVQETDGYIDFALNGNGTFGNPQFDGRLNLSNASAYLPSAGIRLKDIGAHIVLNRNHVAITSFQIRSGPGSIGGSATLRLENRRISSFQGSLKGERFQTVNLPELQASINPELTFDGTTKIVRVNGSIFVPEALFQQQQKETLIKPSADVVIKGNEKKPEKASPFPLDIKLSVDLGDRVLLKAFGINTKLDGTLHLVMKDIEDIRARGVVSTVDGKYDAYGVKLDIRQGNVVFSGDSLDRGTLDVLATRKVDDVEAGVKITGMLAAPLVDLYSKPSMPDMDILSYIVLGRPGYSGQNDMALLARAAGALLTSGQSSGLENRLKKNLALDTIEIQSGNGDISQSIIMIGKYLSPKLYISYGRSIFTGENLFGLRYNLSKRIDLESTMGNESSVIIYYKIEFN